MAAATVAAGGPSAGIAALAQQLTDVVAKLQALVGQLALGAPAREGQVTAGGPGADEGPAAGTATGGGASDAAPAARTGAAGAPAATNTQQARRRRAAGGPEAPGRRSGSPSRSRSRGEAPRAGGRPRQAHGAGAPATGAAGAPQAPPAAAPSLLGLVSSSRAYVERLKSRLAAASRMRDPDNLAAISTARRILSGYEREVAEQERLAGAPLAGRPEQIRSLHQRLTSDATLKAWS